MSARAKLARGPRPSPVDYGYDNLAEPQATVGNSAPNILHMAGSLKGRLGRISERLEVIANALHDRDDLKGAALGTPESGNVQSRLFACQDHATDVEKLLDIIEDTLGVCSIKEEGGNACSR